MKIVLTTWGTTGDIQPFLALARKLHAVGHDVRVCTSDLYRHQFSKLGVDFRPVGIPFDRRHFDAVMNRIIQTKNPLRSAMMVAHEGILKGAKKWYYDSLPAMKGRALAICHSADIPGQEAAIRSKIPLITVSFCPGFIKTKYAPPITLPELGKFGNQFLWRLTEFAMRSQIDPMFNKFLGSIGGKKRKLIGLEGMYSPRLNLIAASPNIAKPNLDLPSNHKFTGAWFFDRPDYKLPIKVQNFLDKSSKKPIIVSFGSMGGSDREVVTKLIISAIRSTGQRAIIQSGWGSLGKNLNDVNFSVNILFVDYIPHQFLFEKATCVIHHGGAGTTASACRSGVPSIVIPHLVDQPYWAFQLEKIGVAPKMLLRKDLTQKRLENRINQVMNSKIIMSNSLQTEKKIRDENGLRVAVEEIEKFPL